MKVHALLLAVLCCGTTITAEAAYGYGARPPTPACKTPGVYGCAPPAPPPAAQPVMGLYCPHPSTLRCTCELPPPPTCRP